jgi:MFS family permease
MSSSINVAIPTIASEFDVLPDRLSWIVTAFLVSTAAVLLPMGRWADIWGRRKTYMAGELLFFAATIGGAFAPDSFLLIFFRAVQGFALAAVYVAYMPILLASQDRTQQGHVLGITVSTTYLGLSSGPFLGGLITQYTSWRLVFLFSAFIIVLSFAFMYHVREEWFGETKVPFNKVGALLSTCGIAALLIGISSYTSQTYAPILFWSGLIILGLFLHHERHTAAAILPLHIFHNMTFVMSNLTALIHYSSTYAISFLLSLYLQLIMHLSASFTGIILLSQPIMMALLSPPAGSLSDRFGPRYIATAGIALTTSGLAAFALLPELTIIQTVTVLIVLGIGAALFGAPNNSAIMSSVDDAHQGTASSMLALARNFGQAASMAMVTLLLTRTVSIMDDYTAAINSGIHTAFSLLAILCCCAVLTSWIRGNPNK